MQVLDMYSDALGKMGFGAICEEKWMWGAWEKEFLQKEPSIEFLELYALTAGVITWISKFRNSKVALFCDNMGVVHMVNSMTSKCSKCMVLIRLLALEGLRHNVKLTVCYVETKMNGKADALSRLDPECFRKLGPSMEENATSIPDEIWPVSKVWFNSS